MNVKIIDGKGGIMNRPSFNTTRGPGVVVIAGLAGGLAEVLWVGASAAVLGVDATHVVREVAATVMPAATATAELGLAVHFALSLALAAVFSYITGRIWPHAGLGERLAAAVVLLASVWAVNFLVVLPWLNPAFTTLLPPGVTFVSKLLFALALWGVFAVLSWNPRARTQRSQASPTGNRMGKARRKYQDFLINHFENKVKE